jgi:DNA/RNA-binding domain of Phe-tRNA-synthetase-like protein
VEILFEKEAKVKFPGISIASVDIFGTKVVETPSWLKEEMRETVLEIDEKYKSINLTEDPVIVAYRKFFRNLGIDPTKNRPSGEALIKLSLKRGRLPIINNVVDSMNIISAKTGVSASTFDADKIKDVIKIRLANRGEEYVPHGEARYRTEGGELVISDSEKILCLYPYRDTILTRVTNDTKNVILQTHGVPGVSSNLVRETAENILKFILKSGESTSSKVVLISS